LTARGVTTPTIGVNLLIFVSKRRFKGAAMQIQFDDIGSGECLLWQIREEQLVDNPCPRDAHRTLLVVSWMGRHNHSAQYTLGSHRHLCTVVEAAYSLAFRTLLDLIWRQVQTCLNERVIKHRVLFASGHKGEASQICQDSPGAILAIEPEQGSFLRKLVCSQIAANGREALTQFLPVASVAPIAKRAEPLETVGLIDDGARPYDLTTLAPRVASSTDLIQSTRGRR
jgi:hypothetical protein